MGDNTYYLTTSYEYIQITAIYQSMGDNTYYLTTSYEYIQITAIYQSMGDNTKQQNMGDISK